jgi:hypothetical protein
MSRRRVARPSYLITQRRSMPGTIHDLVDRHGRVGLHVERRGCGGITVGISRIDVCYRLALAASRCAVIRSCAAASNKFRQCNKSSR